MYLISSNPGVQAGAIFVDQTAKAHFAQVFSAANLNADVTREYIDQALKSFELEAKKSFKGAEDESIVKVGGSRLTERSLGIRRGNMTLEG